MKFNWMNLVGALPYIIVGIQTVKKDASGASKKQIAMESLGLATAVSQAILPEGQAQEAQVFSTAIGNLIDNIVLLAHANNEPGFGQNSLPAAPGAISAPEPTQTPIATEQTPVGSSNAPFPG